MKNRSSVFAFERRAFQSLLFVFVALVCLYGYFLSASMINIVIRKELEGGIAKLDPRVAELEAVYLSKKRSVDLSLAEEMGFEKIVRKSFVMRQSLLGQRTRFDNEI